LIARELQRGKKRGRREDERLKTNNKTKNSRSRRIGRIEILRRQVESGLLFLFSMQMGKEIDRLTGGTVH